LSADTEASQLRERVSTIPDLEQARERADASAVNALTSLSEQRELVGRLTAQIEAAANSTQQFRQRISELADTEQTLRRELTQRDSDLVAQRALVSRVNTQLESAASQETQCRQRIAAFEVLEGKLRTELSERESSLAELREQLGGIRAKLEAAESTIQKSSSAQALWDGERIALQGHAAQLSVSNTELQTKLSAERTHSEERLGVLLTAREELTNQFKSISADILEEKSRKFTEQNATALGQILGPVRDQLQAMHTKVEEVYRTEGQERAALGEQLRQLLQLNHALSTDAQNLTRALKGDQKTQGTWGEIVLDTVLEQAGLIEGTHYDRQSAYEAEDQKRAIPDVVVRLPGDRQLVIDSKVSLTAYERSANATSPEERELHIKQHVTSLRNHIRSLSEKNYQQLYQLRSLDFVLLFIPLEPAFAAAVSHDNLIFREAWDRNVILVSPSSLLFTIRTVAYLWRQESQARNVLEIAKRGAALYDKLCGFVESLEELGKRIQQSAKAYDGVMRRLALGDGNLIRQAEMLRDLGVRPSKQLPMQLVDRAQSKAQQALPADVEDSQEPSEDVASAAPSTQPPAVEPRIFGASP
jgi:DNA recombination protein RmuC